MNNITRGNLLGIGALLMWSSMIAIVRSVTEAFGVAMGTALIYTVGALATFARGGLPDIRQAPKIYLYVAGGLFVLYEIVYSQAIGLAADAQQTLEVGMLNYLWPCLTVVFSIWINKTKLSWLVWPGTALTVAGLYWCVASNGGMEITSLIGNIRQSPLPYILGITAGITWALYCNLSVSYSKGFNAIPLFFTVIAAILWIRFFAQGGELHFPGLWPLCQLLFIGAVMGFSYSMWENGIHHGNFLLLAVCSYFIPAASMLFATIWLKTMPPANFWIGVSLVVGGSLLCWVSRRR